MRPVHLAASSLLLTTALTSAPAFAAPDVVTSIKPVHSLVSAVMGDVGTPSLLVEGAASPHGYSLRPSQAAALQEADLVFWIGPGLEAFLEGPLETVAAEATTVSLMDLDGLTLLDIREGGVFDAHDHDHGHDHGHEEASHDDHAHDDHDHDHDHGKEEHAHDDHDHDHGHDDHAHDDHDHDHEEAAEHDHDHDHGHEHEHEETAGHDHDHDHGEEHAGHDHAGHSHGDGHDAHLWLDPANAVQFVNGIEAALSEADPDNASTYAANAAATIERLEALQADVEGRLAGLGDSGFVVFHDAYQYFENRFGLQIAGSITVNPEVLPGPERLREIKERVEELGGTCVFSEPQFEPRLIGVVTEGTDAKPGVLDPLGAEMTDGPDLYFELIETMTASFEDCLGETG